MERFPAVAARLYDYLFSRPPMHRMYAEIARDLASSIDRGRLLDVGTGPGRLLLQIHALNPEIELHGLDVSDAMIALASRNLSSIRADLRVENVSCTSYESDFFDLVTCTGSFYLWNEPVRGLDEIFRILRWSRAAYLFESLRDVELHQYREALQANLRQAPGLVRILGPLMLRKQLQMTYSLDELSKIVQRSRFGRSFEIKRITLVGLPIWVRIELVKSE